MTGEVRPARLRISLTPPLTAVAQDAEEAAISISALLSADVHRGRSLAREAWQALALSPEQRTALRRGTSTVMNALNAARAEALRQQYAAHIGTAKRDGRSVESVTIETDNTR